MSRSGHAIPVFKLYGENLAWPTPDLLHCESIPERSQLHDWEIREHRHADLGQLLYVQSGHASLDVEGRVIRVTKPSIQVVPPLCVHGFRFSTNIAGYVITVAMPFIEWLQQNLSDAHPVLHEAGCHPAGADKPYIDMLCRRINQGYVTPGPGRDFLLRSLVGALVTWVGRQQLVQREAAWRPERAHVHISAFSGLVEQHYREHWPVSRYAAELAITAAQLNNVCQRLLRCSALDHLHQRLLLEAKRNLIYTTLTVAQISDLLGFAEAPYFSRFFRRLTNVTPREFRQGGASSESAANV
ncbi:helix-turn-helix domain-containing protein [Paraburkholderia fungorum]